MRTSGTTTGTTGDSEPEIKLKPQQPLCRVKRGRINVVEPAVILRAMGMDLPAFWVERAVKPPERL